MLEALVEHFARAYGDSLPAHACPSWAIARYQAEPHGHIEKWLSPRQLLEQGAGDCEDHVIYELVRHRRAGRRAHPKVYRTRRPRRFHTIVVVDGQWQDVARAALAARRALAHRPGGTR